MTKLIVLSSFLLMGTVMANEKITKEQHMAAEASCKAIKADMKGKELKQCIKTKLGITDPLKDL